MFAIVDSNFALLLGSLESSRRSVKRFSPVEVRSSLLHCVETREEMQLEVPESFPGVWVNHGSPLEISGNHGVYMFFYLFL